MADKIFRDPLYNYISVDKKDDEWLLSLRGINYPTANRIVCAY